MFDDVNKIMKEGKERWDKIEALCEELKTEPSNNTVKLMLLLVEHLRPMNPTEESIDELTNQIGDLLKSIKR